MRQFLNRWAMTVFLAAVALNATVYAWVLCKHNRQIATLEIEVRLLRDRAERGDITLEGHRRRLRDLER